MKPHGAALWVGYVCGAYRVSERHPCEVVRLPRARHRYQSIRDPLTALRLRMRELAQTRVSYEYRMIRVLLSCEGWQVGKKFGVSLYREEGLGLRITSGPFKLWPTWNRFFSPTILPFVRLIRGQECSQT